MPKRVLIVDDEPDLVRVVDRLLRVAGYETEAVGDGVAAVERVQQAPPDLVLLDVMMPEMNGFVVCRLLKSQARTCHVPVVILTAKDHPADRYWGEAAGADAYLTKPFEADDVLAAVARLLVAPGRN